MTPDEMWIDLLRRYLIVKEVFIEGEETDPELKTNLQPLNEFRALLDHTMRMLAEMLKQNEGSPEEAEIRFAAQYEKAKNHLCRAFYDICDLTSINYRNMIVQLLEPYSNDVIQAVIPEYYSRIRPRIDEINQEIAGFRSRKGTDDAELDRFDQYHTMLQELKSLHKEIASHSGALAESASRAKAADVASRRFDIKLGLVCAAVGAVVGFILSAIFL